MREVVRKKEVEELLGCKITEERFQKALEYATHKQAYIYKTEKRPIVLSHWYLVMLTEEYVRNLAFEEFTLDLCGTLADMEKEHSTKKSEHSTDIHIVTVSAL